MLRGSTAGSPRTNTIISLRKEERMSKIIEDFVSDWTGYTEEYPDWINTWIEAALISFGIGITIALVTITVCQSL